MSTHSAEAEAIASFRVLVCLARADGTIDDRERASLLAAFETIPDNPRTLASLLAEDILLPDALAAIQSTEARERTYQAACTLLCADRVPSPQEVVLLDCVRDTL